VDVLDSVLVGIRSGRTCTLPLLDGADVTISGPAADQVRAELHSQAPARLLLTPCVDAGGADATFEVRLHHVGGDEVLRFFIVADDAAVRPGGWSSGNAVA